MVTLLVPREGGPEKQSTTAATPNILNLKWPLWICRESAALFAKAEPL